MISSVDGGAVIAFDGAVWRNTTKEVNVQDKFDEQDIGAAASAGFIAHDLAIMALIATMKTMDGFDAEKFRDALAAIIPQPEDAFEERQHEILIRKLNSYVALAGSKGPL